jgi:hypothetical protein
MAVNATVSRATLVAAGAQTEFNFNFTIKNNSDLEVYQRAPTTTPSDSDKIILTQDYVVAIDAENGGTVSLNVGATAGDIIIIQTNIPFERAADFTDQKQYTADNVNADLDNTIIGQKQNDMRQTELTPHYADSSLPTEQRDLSLPVLGVNQVWRQNSDGTAIGAADFPGDDPGAAALRADLLSTGGAGIVGTDMGFPTVQDALDETYYRGPLYAVDQDLGNPDEINVTISPSTPSYEEGELLIVRAAQTNAGNVTINKDGLGFQQITDFLGTQIPPGDIQGSQILSLVYSGGRYIYSNRSAVSTFPLGYQFGIEVSNGTVDPLNDLEFSEGTVKDAEDRGVINLSSVITKRTDAVWAEGDSQGGTPSGVSLTADTWYSVWVIGKSDGSGTDAGIDEINLTTPTNLLADAAGDGYTFYRRRAYWYVNSSMELEHIIQIDDTFMFGDQYEDSSIFNALSTTPATIDIIAPTVPRILCTLRHGRNVGSSAATRFSLLSSLEENLTAPSGARYTWQGNYDVGFHDSSYLPTIVVNGQVQIESSANSADTTLITTADWTDPRIS